MKTHFRILTLFMAAAVFGTAFLRAQEENRGRFLDGLLERFRTAPEDSGSQGRFNVPLGDFSDLLRDWGIQPGDLSTPEGWQELFRRFGEEGQGIPWEDFFEGFEALPGHPAGPAPLDPEDEEKLYRQYMDLKEAHRPALREVSESTVSVHRGNSENPVALGTVVHEDGWILTKASEVEGAQEPLRCAFHDGEIFSARVVRTFEEYDLALLRVDRTGLRPVLWYAGPPPRLGSFLAAPGRDGDAVAIGVLSVAARSLEKTRGYLGVQMEAIDEGVRIVNVQTGTPAEQAGIQEGDVVVAVQGEDCRSMMQLAMAVGNRRPGEEVEVKVLREGEERVLRIKLAERPSDGPDARLEMMNRLGGRLSRNREGFRNAIQTDLPLKPEQCGGPLVDLQGNVVGINIARAGRIQSYALASTEVAALLNEVDFTGGVQPAAESAAAESAGAPSLESSDTVEALQAEARRTAQAVESAREALRRAEEAAREASEALRRLEPAGR